MATIYEIDESKYKADFMISENYIKFSSELLRLSLLAIGGFGTLVLTKIKEEHCTVVLQDIFFIIALLCFVICSGASLCHRYYASDAMSWYICLLRAQNNNNASKIKKERAGLHKILKFSRISLISSEISFGLGVIFFFISILKLILA
jgi:hypothetical protein